MREAIKLLKELRKDIMEHALFEAEIYEAHDLDEAVEIGGDACFLLCCAWQADNIIELLERLKDAGS